jgi:large subunit ribosomal protein L3
MTLILGRKLGMTQLFAEDGTVTGVTVVQAGPCVVTQVRTQDKDGYDAVQLGFEDLSDKRARKPQAAHCKKAGTAPKRFLREDRAAEPATLAVGDTVTVGEFQEGDRVDVIGTMKGRGFAGTIKRHGFSRGPETHGSMNVRAPGSLASRRIGKVQRGKRLGGHYGAKRHTTRNLTVMRVDPERHLLFIKGAVPGPPLGMVQVRGAKYGMRPAARAATGPAAKAATGKR